MQRAIELSGLCLHRGTPASLRLVAAAGPIVFEQRGVRCPLAALRVVRSDRGVTVASPDERLRVDLVEHLLAALGGLGVHRGLRICSDDPELPLLDGGALRFAEALRNLDLPATAPSLRVAREASFTRGASVYRFVPGPAITLSVQVRFRAPVGEEEARWSGDADDFVARIAPARTFGWVDEYEALRAAGRAAGVDLASVLVFDERGALPGCRPAAPTEVARHKLLDLLGDLTLHGGPPRGALHALAPGHSATHALVREALDQGVLVRDEEAGA